MPDQPHWLHRRTTAMAGVACLAVMACVLYAGNMQHDFFLDDAHSIVENRAVRSLTNIPAFFFDAGMFSTSRDHVDYRPVLLTSFAMNYAMANLAMPWWHATQLLLHVIVALGIAALARRVILQNGLASEHEPAAVVVPWIAALLFAVHPVNSGVVNYMAARSSLLTAAFVLPSIVLYLRAVERKAMPWGSVTLFALGLLTKVEGIAALGVFILAELLGTARQRLATSTHGSLMAPLVDVRDTLRSDVLWRLAPFLAVSAVYFAWRAHVMAPFPFDETRRSAAVSTLDYLRTQLVVWWIYVRQWFLPIGLVADHGSFPVYRSVLRAPVVVALAGWTIVATLLWLSWRRRPWVGFLAIAALALVSPTSSIAPLAEMLNEHRPYLPRGVLSLVWILPVGVWLVRAATGVRPSTQAAARRGMIVAAPLLLVVVLSGMTVQRNRAFTTNRAYLADINAKAPSHRSLMNFGLILLGEGNYAAALDYFERARRLAPNWPYVHVNLGIVNRALGDTARAEAHFDLAVQYDRTSGMALVWRGGHRLARRQFDSARLDFENARGVSLQVYEVRRGLATAYAGLGRIEDALAATRECLRIDRARAGVDIVSMAQPFFDDPQLARGGLAYFTALEREMPDAWWIAANIATLARRIGDSVTAEAAAARSAALRR